MDLKRTHLCYPVAVMDQRLTIRSDDRPDYAGHWVFTDQYGTEWRLMPTGDPSTPLIIIKDREYDPMTEEV